MHKCPIEAGCSDRETNQTCAGGYTGPKCALCDADHFYSKFEDECRSCSQDSEALAGWLLLSMMGAMLFIMLCASFLARWLPAGCAKSWRKVFDLAKFKVRAHQNTSRS